jgi:hypothetical protein
MKDEEATIPPRVLREYAEMLAQASRDRDWDTVDYVSGWMLEQLEEEEPKRPRRWVCVNNPQHDPGAGGKYAPNPSAGCVVCGGPTTFREGGTDGGPVPRST